MANTFRVNWFKKLLNTCTPTRKYRPLDDTHTISSTMDMTILSGSRKAPKLPEQAHSSMTSRTVRFQKCPTATAVRIHPVIRNLNSSNKQKRSLSLACQKRRREEQLTKNLGSQASSVHPRPIPLKIVAMRKLEQAQHSIPYRMGWQDFRDSVVARNIDKLVRETQAKSRNRRAKRKTPQEITVTVTASIQDKPKKGLAKKGLAKKELPKKGLPIKGLPKKGLPMKGLAKKGLAKKGLATKTIGLVNFPFQERHMDKDIRLSRMPPKLEYNARRAASSSSTDDPSRGNLPGRSAYHMRIAHVKFRFLIKRNHRKTSKDSAKIISKTKTNTKTKTKTKPQAIGPYPGTSKLVQEEQKRLDILRAEWVQLKGLENAVRLNKSLRIKELNRPMDPEPETSTDLDLNSLIVDPKSFLTQVHVKSKIFSLDYGDYRPDEFLDLENPIGFPDPTKASGFGETDDDGLLPLVPQ